MHLGHEPAAVIVDVGADDVAVFVVAGQNSDDALRRGIQEAAVRAGRLRVVQLTDDPSAVRRGLAKAVLVRDAAWWARSETGLAVVVDVVRDGSTDEALASVEDTACVVVVDAALWGTDLWAALQRLQVSDEVRR